MQSFETDKEQKNNRGNRAKLHDHHMTCDVNGVDMRATQDFFDMRLSQGFFMHFHDNRNCIKLSPVQFICISLNLLFLPMIKKYIFRSPRLT